jgi:hypothetical protein
MGEGELGEGVRSGEYSVGRLLFWVCA